MSELFPMRTMALEVFRCEDVSRMSEFNFWYDKVRIPAYRQIPGVVSVHRYIARDFDYGEYTPGFFKAFMEAPVRYLTIYRINAKDPWAVCEKIKEVNEQITFDCMNSLEFGMYDFYATRQRIQPLLKQPPTHLPDGMPELMLIIPNANYVKDLETIDDWWLYTHAHDLMEIPGYVQCSRYHNITPTFTEGDPLGLNFYEIDSDDPVNWPSLDNIIGDQQRAKDGRVWGHIANPPGHPTFLLGTFEHWDIMGAI